MTDRESILPLATGAVIAVLVHAMLLPSLLQLPWGGDATGRVPRHGPDTAPMIESPPDITFGVDDGLVSSAAWIPYDDYVDLVAPKGKNLQPAVQQEVDPLPDAQVVPDPTPPAPPTPDDAPTPAPVSPQVAVTDTAAPAVPPSPVIDSPPPDSVGDLAAGPPQPEQPPQPQVQPQPQPQPQPEPAPAASAGGRPTAAPRSDRDADPVMLTDSPLPVRPGRVLAADGIEIKTVRPDFSLSTRLTSMPFNPVVRITFNPDGSVYEATIIQSSGYNDVDGPLLTSLYRWRAGGERIAKLNRRVTGEWKIVLIEE